MSNLDARLRIDRHADLLAEALARTIDGMPYDPLSLETPVRVSALTGYSTMTLAIWRTRGEGPPYVRIGRTIRYPRDKLIGWLNERARLFEGDAPPRRPCFRERLDDDDA